MNKKKNRLILKFLCTVKIYTTTIMSSKNKGWNDPLDKVLISTETKPQT